MYSIVIVLYLGIISLNRKAFSIIQGFLRNERENAILAAIEEAKKNVSLSLILYNLLQ